jgi:hypothetical protein
MRIVNYVLAASAMLLAGATVVEAKEYRTFKQDGVTYTYRIIERGDKKVIVGKSELLGQTSKFSLTVKNGKVRGDFDGRNIAFFANEARAQNIQLAAD